jgi:hypothetical protein
MPKISWTRERQAAQRVTSSTRPVTVRVPLCLLLTTTSENTRDRAYFARECPDPAHVRSSLNRC